MNQEANARAFRFAAFAVIGLGAAIVALSVYYTLILSSRDFCATVVGSKTATAAPSQGVVTACANLMAIQLKAVATNSYINSTTIAICLVGLVILVIAGGRFTFKAGREGIEGSMSHDVAEAAGQVADAAADKADQIKGEA